MRSGPENSAAGIGDAAGEGWGVGNDVVESLKQINWTVKSIAQRKTGGKETELYSPYI